MWRLGSPPLIVEVPMRVTIIFTALVSLTPSLASAQPSCHPPQADLVAFDPYKPSHLAIVRNYGAAALAHFSIQSLLQLDPYVPSEGALLRQLGGGIPAWAGWPYGVGPAPLPGAPSSTCEDRRTSDVAPAAVITTFSDALARVESRTSLAARGVERPASAARNAVTIDFDGRTWSSAGAAVPFVESDFVRAGERASQPVFLRARGDAGTIYVPTTAGMVAPFRVLSAVP
jgi:hypothetical protein